MAKAKTYKRKIVKEVKAIKIRAEKGEVLRRTFKIENITDNAVEVAGYIFEQRKIKKLCSLTIEEYKAIKACKSLRII